MGKILGTLFKGILSFVGFLILLIILNLFAAETKVPIFQEFVTFFNSNLVLICWITLVMIIGEIFGVFKLPFNVPAPIFDAVGGVLIVVFISNLFMLLIKLSEVNWNIPYSLIFLIIEIIVAIIVLIVGYYKIFKDHLPLVIRKENKDKQKKKVERKEQENEDNEGEDEEDSKKIKAEDLIKDKPKKKKKKEKFY
jgi:hypothetical protein